MTRLRDNRLIAVGTLAGSLLAAASLVGGGIVYAVRLRDDATASRSADADHENRMRAIEVALPEMHADIKVTREDVSWIRKFLDRPLNAQNDHISPIRMAGGSDDAAH